MSKTGLVYCEETLLHDTGPLHPERPARLVAVLKGLENDGLHLPRVKVQAAEREDLLRVHSPGHLALLERCCRTGRPYPDPDTVMGAASWKAALLAAGGAISACRDIVSGLYDNVFWLMRPPSHHAEVDHAMGFCLFNNVAVAARWLQAEAGIKRIAILDWDIHHGNGTQHIFYEDASVYYISLHQHPHFPGTGFPEERGAQGTNLNIQFAPNTAAEAWLLAMEKQVVPELEAFSPDILLISCGFDAHHLDPLGLQQLDATHFGQMTEMVKHIADGRIVSFIEGGYHLEALATSAVAHVRALQA